MENSSVKALTSRQDCVEAVETLINAAELSIAIFSQQLEPLLYNHSALCEKMSALARKNRHSRIRILAQQTLSASSNGHCLINLSQKLSSYIQIRLPSTMEIQRFSESWLIVDNHSICQISNLERYEGTLIQHDRLHVKTQLEFFDHAWENSLPDQQTRRLHI